MRSSAIEIPLKNPNKQDLDFLDLNGFDYEFSYENDEITLWIHNKDHSTSGYAFQHFRNFNKLIFQKENKFFFLKNRYRDNDACELFEEDINGDTKIKGKKYENIKKIKIKKKDLNLALRIDEIEALPETLQSKSKKLKKTG